VVGVGCGGGGGGRVVGAGGRGGWWGLSWEKEKVSVLYLCMFVCHINLDHGSCPDSKQILVVPVYTVIIY